MQQIFDDLCLYGYTNDTLLYIQRKMIADIKTRFCDIHETPTKELTVEQKAELHALRRICQQLGVIGYWIVKK